MLVDHLIGVLRQSRRGLWLIVLSALLWGTVGVTTQTLYQTTPTNPLSIGFFRLALATPVLLIISWSMLGRRMLRITRRDLGVMTLIGAMLALYQVCFFAAIPRVGVAIATLVTLCMAPVLVALLSVVLTRERPSRTVVLALLAAIIGTVLLVGIQSPTAGRPTDLLGVVFALGSALGYAIITLAGRAVAGRYHPLQINTVGFATGALFLLFPALATGFVISYPPFGWLLLGYLGLVPTALGYVLFLAGMRSTSATVASIVTLLEPLTATVLAWLLFGEQLGSYGVLGALCLLGAIGVLYVRRE